MKKICPECETVYVGYANIEACPSAHCEPVRLIHVDDLYVDVVQKFLSLSISFVRVEAGTLEEHNSGPFVCFVDTWLEGSEFTLEMFREMALKVSDESVIVSEIVQKEEYKALVVESVYNSDDTSPLARFDSHVSFVKYLYRLLDELEGQREQIYKLVV